MPLFQLLYTQIIYLIIKGKCVEEERNKPGADEVPSRHSRQLPRHGLHLQERRHSSCLSRRSGDGPRNQHKGITSEI